MHNSSSRYEFLIIGAALLGLSLFVGAGCGDSDEAVDKCEGVTCDFGVCNSSTGKCTNRDSCNVDADCIAGYECTDGACESLNECSSDEDCEAGVCRNEACVNPKSCEENSDCLARTYCDTTAKSGDKGKCKPDPCNDLTCRRGICKRGTDECVSKESCTPESELLDCVSGEKCAVTGDNEEGTCLDSEEFCNTISCGDNGVCDFNAGGCTDAKDCEGDDGNCLTGKFCNDQNRCQDNLCELNDIDCERGVCDPATGECQNAENCNSSEECDAGHLCVEGTCKLEGSACGDAGGDGGCPGNQTCSYDDEELTATCEEPDVCNTSLDCSENRQCGGRVCLSPESCAPDPFEENDSSDNATDFGEASDQNSLEASACSGDTDIYTVDTADISGPAQDGTLVVQVDVPERERGLGKLNLKVTGPDDNEIGSTSTGALGAEARAEVTSELGLADLGEYTVTVSAGEDMTEAGVNYKLSANLLPKPTAEACSDAPEIRVEQRVSGSTENSESSAFTSSCAPDSQESPEKVYKLKVDSPQEVSFELNPQLSSSDFSMSLRRACAQTGSEVACSDETEAGEKESFTKLLGAGTYYLVVQAAGEEATGGGFEVNTSRVLTACAPQDNYCTTDGSAHACTSDGGRFETIDCNAGCNPSEGFCKPPAGDRCGTAETIDPQNTQQRVIQLNQLRNRYQIESDTEGCLGEGDTRTGGPEKTYKVKLPKQRAITATAFFENEVEGSLSIVKDCSDASGSCQKGAVDSTESDFRETITYSNDSMSSETVYLIVDTAAGQSVGTATLDVVFNEVTCTPGMKQCGSNATIEQCGPNGIGYKTIGKCGAKCSSAKCLSDNCSDAVNITSRINSGGAQFTGNWGRFSDDYRQDDTCGGDGGSFGISESDTEGDESVYQIDMKAGERLDATVSGNGSFVLYLKSPTNCGQADTPCQASAEAEDGDDASISYLATSDETVNMVVDREETDDTGTFTIDASLTQAQCNPASYTPSCQGSFDLQYCTSIGKEETRTCAFGCDSSSNACTSEQTCPSPVNLTSAASASGGITFTGLDWGDLSADDQDGEGCGVSSFDTDGHEFVYAIDLQSGEKVTADVTNNDPGFTYEAVFVTDSCQLSTSSCLDGESAFDDPVSATYTHSGSGTKTVYVIIESDTTFGVDGDTFDVNINVQ